MHSRRMRRCCIPQSGPTWSAIVAFAYGDPETAFAAAAHRVHLTVRYPRNSCTPIECYVVLAEHLPGDEGYEVLSNFMGPYSLHAVMALALKVPAARVAAEGAARLGRQLRRKARHLCLHRADVPGLAQGWGAGQVGRGSARASARGDCRTARLTTIEAAVDSDGSITALAYDQCDDVGGYLRAPEPATFYRMHGCLTGAYAARNLRVRNRVVLTNKTPAGLVRGFGGPQVYFALERLVAAHRG